VAADVNCVTHVDTAGARFSAAALNVICISYYNVLALIVGSAADDRGLPPDQLGFAASAFLAGLALVNFAGFLWLRRFNWRWLVAVSNTIASVAFLYPVFVFSFETWFVCNLLAGIATGISYGVSIACLGDGRQKERNFALAYLGQTFLSAVIIFFLPRIPLEIDIFALGQGTAALLMLLGIGLLPLLPAAGAPTRAMQPAASTTGDEPRPDLARIALIMALAVLMLNVAAEGGVWTFLERIAVANGHDTRFAATVIAASFFTAGTGSLLAALAGARFGRIKPFLVAVAASIASVVLFWLGSSAAIYVVAVLLFAAAWNLGSPYRMALAVDADISGRYTTFVPAMQALGATIGPAVAGILVVDGSFTYVYVFSITIWVATIVLFLAAVQRLRKYRASAGVV
jgi:MFS family permease